MRRYGRIVRDSQNPLRKRHLSPGRIVQCTGLLRAPRLQLRKLWVRLRALEPYPRFLKSGKPVIGKLPYLKSIVFRERPVRISLRAVLRISFVIP